MENNMEVSKKLVELENKNRKCMVSLYDSVLECLKKFDGKQVTKRIETALKKIDNNINLDSSGNSLIISLYFKDRLIQNEDRCYYLKNFYENFCHCSRFSSCGDGILNSDNSLNYEMIEKEMIKHKEYIIKSIEESEKQLKNIDYLMLEYEELKNQCNQFNHKIHRSIAEHFDIKSFTNY